MSRLVIIQFITSIVNTLNRLSWHRESGFEVIEEGSQSFRVWGLLSRHATLRLKCLLLKLARSGVAVPRADEA